MIRAAVECINGVADGLIDYRGVPVVAAYICISELNLGSIYNYSFVRFVL